MIQLQSLNLRSFPSFLITGLVFSIVLGVGALAVLASVFRLPDWDWAQRLNPLSAALDMGGLGLALMIWITAQALMIGLSAFSQVLYFGVGLAILLLTPVPSVRGYLRSRGKP